MVLPAVRPAPAGGGRDRPVRPQLVQPRRRRARDGLRLGTAGRGLLPRCPGVRAHACPVGNHPHQVLVLNHGSGAAAALPHADPRSHQAMEAVTDGPSVARSLGALHAGEGGDVRADQHPGSPLEHRRRQRQEARAPELHRAPAVEDSLRRGAARSDHAAGARVQPRLRAPRDRVRPYVPQKY